MTTQAIRRLTGFGLVIGVAIGGSDHALAQPVMHAQHLIAFDGASGDEFGWDAATSGKYMVIGSPSDNALGPFSGAVYVYKETIAGGMWEFQVKLTETDGVVNSSFGSHVSITPGIGLNGGLLAIGHAGDSEFGNASGAVFIHAETSIIPVLWAFQKKITSVDPGLNRQFGASVAIDNSTLLVGSPFDDDPVADTGSAHIHYRTQGGANGWGSVKKLIPPDPTPGKLFGENVDLDGNIAVIGARADATMGSETGAAYLYLRNTGGLDNWGFVKKLLAPDGEGGDQFGFAVAIDTDNNIVAVGARSDDDAAIRAGATYIFGRNVGGVSNWGFVKKLIPPDGMSDAFIGHVVALHGGILVTGSRSDYGVAPSAGAFYVYGQDIGGPDNWGFLYKIVAPDAMATDLFAHGLDIHNGVIVSGARLDDTPMGMDSGSAHVFAIKSLCPQDLNGDGVVDTADLGILIGSFGMSGLGDINGDGVIDTADLGILIGGFSETDCAYGG